MISIRLFIIRLLSNSLTVLVSSYYILILLSRPLWLLFTLLVTLLRAITTLLGHVNSCCNRKENQLVIVLVVIKHIKITKRS